MVYRINKFRKTQHPFHGKRWHECLDFLTLDQIEKPPIGYQINDGKVKKSDFRIMDDLLLPK